MPTPIAQSMNHRSSALNSARLPAQPEEYDIHAAIAEALVRAGLGYTHEYRLSP